MSGFLGTGWAFPPRRPARIAPTDPPGDVVMASDEDLIAQSIWLILATAPGERVQRPDFGCGVHNLVFAVNDSGAATRVAAAVRSAIVKFEPRVDLLGVVVTSPPGEPNTLEVDITYRVRTTNNRFNLVYPFFLQGAGA